MKRTVESLIPPHVIPWLVYIWIGTGCSKTKMHLTAFCNVWACQPTCMRFSEKIVIGVEEPGEFEKTEPLFSGNCREIRTKFQQNSQRKKQNLTRK